ncbi:MAG: hypothetical protein ACYS32_04350 [Planctomycetota bacterium]|jgi:hypothetical protein
MKKKKLTKTERDLRKTIAKHVLWLKEIRRKMESGIETGEMRFY